MPQSQTGADSASQPFESALGSLGYCREDFSSRHASSLLLTALLSGCLGGDQHPIPSIQWCERSLGKVHLSPGINHYTEFVSHLLSGRIQLAEVREKAGAVWICPRTPDRNAEHQGANPLLNDMSYQLVWSEPQETHRAGVPSHQRVNHLTVSLTQVTP